MARFTFMGLILVAFALLAQNPATPEPVEVPFRTVSFGANGQIKDGGAIVIRDAKEFDAYRKKMNLSQGKKPKVDWGREQIVSLHAAGVGYGGSALQVSKVWRKADGTLDVEAFVEQGNRPAVPTPGVAQILRKEGIYVMIVVPPSKGEVALKVVDPPRDRGDKSGKSGSP